MRTCRWVCTIRYDRRNAERLMCSGCWPGIIGEHVIAVTGVHSSIGGHSHGVERVNDEVSCCSSTSVSLWSFADQNLTLCLSGSHPCFANREEAEKNVRARNRTVAIQTSTPGSCNLLPPGSHAPTLLHRNLQSPC